MLKKQKYLKNKSTLFIFFTHFILSTRMNLLIFENSIIEKSIVTVYVYHLNNEITLEIYNRKKQPNGDHNAVRDRLCEEHFE